ncbi:hypothetical protein MMC18_007802 [Xylographa bjoerkii]|nr:hypothetical protein [Xylographa bjoerkii]
MAESYPDRRVQRSATGSSILGGIGQRLTSLSLQRKPTQDIADDQRGPPGLRTLTDPRDPFVELIFVHGWRGGSRSTWTCNNDMSTFWPLWLADERDFDHVRIHTFGYDADFMDRRVSGGNINDFGILLMEALVNGNPFKRDVNVRGLVLFNLAKQNPGYLEVSQRFHTVLFLATPHRGADNNIMLNNILRASAAPGPRGYSGDLEPNSAAFENINENFLHSYHGTRLWSFYETIPTLANTNELVVDRHLATLGLPEERPVPLTANHCGVCRFTTSSDPSYHNIRDALASSVEEILEELLNPEKVEDQMRILAEYLCTSESEDEELSNIEVVPGSCEWLLQKESFIEWRDSQADSVQAQPEPLSRIRSITGGASYRSDHRKSPRFFWLSGPPGTGKSVLSAHVVRHLHNRDCSFYFLKHSDKSKQNLNGLLRSIAFQMARRDVSLRQSLLTMRQEEGLTAETNDIRVLWKQLFVQRVLRSDFQQRQYWVIDALDECHSGYELVPLLAKISEHLPLSIFLTSRWDHNLEKMLGKLPIVAEQINIRDTLGDIRLCLEASQEDFPVDEPAEVEELIEKLVLKSRGSFLWTRLILQKLENSWTDAAVDEVLADVPDGMNQLYTRILTEMSQQPNKELARSILRWIICAARPLTILEMQEAIRLDIGQRVPKMERMIERVCGQLVVIDNHGKIQLTHDTVRDFLLSEDLDSEFSIDKAEAHGHLADICLRYLIAEHIKAQAPRRSQTPLLDTNMSGFQEYANLFFSEHVVKSPPTALDIPTNGLEKFLETSVLSWIEYIARSKDLSSLTQTAKNFKSYVERRVDYQAPLSPGMKAVQDWAVDLIRLVTVFGRPLLYDPSAIHRIIPPLCPRTSILFRRFGNPPLGLEVAGLSFKEWSDKIAQVSFPEDHTLALACCERRYGLGLRSGYTILYHPSTCQETLRVYHGEQVKQLVFATANDWVVMSGKERMSMWNYEFGQNIWTTELSHELLALTLTDDDSTILAATKAGEVVFWNMADGEILERLSWHNNQRGTRTRPPLPQQAHISSELNLLVLIYRNQPLTLYDLGDIRRPRYIPTQATVSAVAFNPALTMLAVAFWDGELCTIGTWDLQKIISINANASHLAATTDGKTLIVGTNSGGIQIHDFDTLSLIHTIKESDAEIMAMMFTSNGLRFMDIRRQEFNVWEPSALVRRKDHDDSTSEGQTSFSTAPSQLVQAYTGAEDPLITACVADHTGEHIFCGKEDGAVAVYETTKGKLVKHLYGHIRTAVTLIDWNSNGETLVSCDTSSRILVHKIKLVQTRSTAGYRETWQAQLILEHRVESAAVLQIILSVDGEYLLVSTSTSDYVWRLDGKILLSHEHSQSKQARAPSQKWTTHPRHKRRIFGIDDMYTKIIEWQRDNDSTPVLSSVAADANSRADYESRDAGVHFAKIGDDLRVAYDKNPSSRPLIWTAPPASTSMTTATAGALTQFHAIAPKIKTIIGMYRSQLIFLGTDGWMSSMRLDEAGQDIPHSRLFPLPPCWQSASRHLIALVTVKGDVVIVKDEELAIVKRGLIV